ncbi:class I SAM-dependent methyltransferase [Modestobacter italicus]|uniref:class I SAM-dependent methyltransferase n=1 Tax=Modestobacter italicus (strain DSM 44449 / CECT 9708 / BC 501) TaxID=2732864 RepID=UPI001C9604D9|nr:methyltransferase domain-containing protein [Modestobacter italicus]
MTAGESRTFFGARAAGWEEKFPDDGPRFERAVAELDVQPGDAVLDAACGTGRALPVLRDATGPAGALVGLDLTPEMLGEARRRGRDRLAGLVQADVTALPFPPATFDVVFASGLVSHLPDPAAGLQELARVARAGARLGLFHPVGRAALARRHGRELSPDDVRAEPRIRALLAAAGWTCTGVDDAEDRWLVRAVRP